MAAGEVIPRTLSRVRGVMGHVRNVSCSTGLPTLESSYGHARRVFQVTVAIFSAGAVSINLVNPGARDSGSRDAAMDNRPAARILLAITRPSQSTASSGGGGRDQTVRAVARAGHHGTQL